MNTLAVKEVWADTLQDHLREKSTSFNITDNKFAGSFNGANKVHFESQNKPIVGVLTSFNDTISTQDIITVDETFVLSEIRYFAVEINIGEDAERYIDPRNELLTGVSEKYGVEIDKTVYSEYANAGYVFDDGDMDVATNGGAGNPIIFTKDNIIGAVINLGQLFDENDVPSNERKLTFSPAEKSLFLKSPEFTKSTESAEIRLKTGIIGEVNGIMIYITNNLQTVAGVKHALKTQGKPVCFGSNIGPSVHVSSVAENQTKFASLIKGAIQYGVKTFSEGAEKMIDIQIKA